MIILLRRLSLASSGSENEGVTGRGIRGGAGRGGGGDGGGGGTGGGTDEGEALILRVDFLPARGALPNLSSTSLLTTSVCSSLSLFISCTLSVVFIGTGLTGDSDPELKLIETDSSKLCVGESVLLDVDLLNVSLADRQIAGEYNLIEQGPEKGMAAGNFVLGVGGIKGGDISDISVSTGLSFSKGGDISDKLIGSILVSTIGLTTSSGLGLSLFGTLSVVDLLSLVTVVSFSMDFKICGDFRSHCSESASMSSMSSMLAKL